MQFQEAGLVEVGESAPFVISGVELAIEPGELANLGTDQGGNGPRRPATA